MPKEAWEEEAKDRFIAALKTAGRGDWGVSDRDVVVATGRNFDFQLRSGDSLIALEIFRLVESKEEIVRQKSWSVIANSIATELRTRGVKGYTIHTPHTFNVPRLKIQSFVSTTADRLEAAIKQNAQIDPITVDGFEIKRIDDFPDVSLFSTGPVGPINPTGKAYAFIADKLPAKNEQLSVANHERVVLIVNWAVLVDRSNMIEACTQVDFSQFGNIDKVYFEIPHVAGEVHLVYDRQIYAAFQPGAEPPGQIEPLFLSWLANHLQRKETQAFRLVRKITEHQNSLLWLPPPSREQLIAFGEDFAKSNESDHLYWIIETLMDDPDPSIDNSPDDPDGRLNDHLRTLHGESIGLIRSVRSRLCWLLMQVVMHPRVNDYERVFEIVERFASGENLYVRQQATVPMIELAKRRFAKLDANTRFMSDELAERIKVVALRMVDENVAYPSVLEWVAHVVLYIQDLDHNAALTTLQQLLTIDQSESANDISSMMIYFAFFRQNQFKHLDPFNPDAIRNLLRDKLTNGSGHFRATAANHFKAILDRKEVEFDSVIPYLEALISGKSNRVMNHHIYQIAAKQASAHPDNAKDLIEHAIRGELKALDAGGREVWHPKDFSEALQTIEKVGAGYQQWASQVRKTLEPYKERGLLFDIYDF